MEDRNEALERFNHDTHDHQMTVVRNDGASRHLQFRKPGSSTYWFDLITWPGSLCINGDMGTHVFSRTEDMFRFFRPDPKYPQYRINPTYWHEKLVAECRHGAKRFCQDKFGEAVYDHFAQFCESNEDLSEEEVSELAEEIEGALERVTNDHEAYSMIAEFSHRVRSGEAGRHGFAKQGRLTFYFQDWETDTKEYTFSFLWCLYAIVWGIECFDSWMDETANATIEAKIATAEGG